MIVKDLIQLLLQQKQDDEVKIWSQIKVNGGGNASQHEIDELFSLNSDGTVMIKQKELNIGTDNEEFQKYVYCSSDEATHVVFPIDDISSNISSNKIYSLIEDEEEDDIVIENDIGVTCVAMDIINTCYYLKKI
ncbi:hypothetical protein BAOM_3035 [Peribacillus asahii]|uniref:Uncharacterized protein n=1 Tax=Peribacillus asahii TaxID=228899 RepID=A0A3T0KTX5_9BACI|nr:hypothetical protein [Peribacillus asahii]AZV43644.1 hypothetical protein BAOM_3035 [Peribacillus asahii]